MHLEHLRGAHRCGTSLIGVLQLFGGAAGGLENGEILKSPCKQVVDDHVSGV